MNYTIFVYIPDSMKNITVTLDEKTAAWARVHAAKQGKSVSRLLGELLQQHMAAQPLRQQRGYLRVAALDAEDLVRLAEERELLRRAAEAQQVEQVERGLLAALGAVLAGRARGAAGRAALRRLRACAVLSALAVHALRERAARL